MLKWVKKTLIFSIRSAMNAHVSSRPQVSRIELLLNVLADGHYPASLLLWFNQVWFAWDVAVPARVMPSFQSGAHLTKIAFVEVGLFVVCVVPFIAVKEVFHLTFISHKRFIHQLVALFYCVRCWVLGDSSTAAIRFRTAWWGFLKLFCWGLLQLQLLKFQRKLSHRDFC